MLGEQARELLVRAYERLRNAQQAADIFGVSQRTVYRYEEEKKAGKSLAVRTSERGRKPVLTEEEKATIRETVKEQPDISIREIKEKLQLSVGDETIRRCVIAAGFRRKRKELHATERDRARCGGKA